MKPNLGRFFSHWIMAACIQIALYGMPLAGSAQTTPCSDPANVIYGLDGNGKIYPITVSNASLGTDINITDPTGANSANAMGYNSGNGRFYYYLANPSNGSSGKFVSYDPVTNTYVTLSTTNGPTQNVYRASITSDGKYFCIDKNGVLYCYTISTNKWQQITNTFVDQNGGDATLVFKNNTSGDMAFDANGNLWFVVSTTGKIGLYKIPGPIVAAPVSSMSITMVIPATTATPVTSASAVGIAFNQTGQIYISLSNDYLYRFENNQTFTYIGNMNLSNSNISDLTSCNFPMTVMPLTWLSFNVDLKNKNQVNMNWLVSNQINNKGFYIQSSRDQVKWENLAYIPSRVVTGLQPEQYLYSYFRNAAGSDFYRIMQEDVDGKKSYSWVKVLNTESKGPVLIYPNPARDELTIVTADQTMNMAQIADLSGRIVKTVPLKAGENKFDISILKSGMYFVSVNQTDGTKHIVKLVKQ